MKHIIDNEILTYMNVFSKITNARLKDCFKYNGVIYFVVEEGDLGKAIGLKGVFIKAVIEKLKKPVKLVEFSKDPAKFIKNFLLPLPVDEVVIENGIVYVTQLDKFVKAKILGKNKRNLILMNELLKRYYKQGLKVYVR